MLQIVPHSIVLNYVFLITVQLKWAWDYLLYQSFFHPNGVVLLPEHADDLNVMSYENESESEECSVVGIWPHDVSIVPEQPPAARGGAPPGTGTVQLLRHQIQ
ncbi:hypothetical protein DH2020_011978 [Rehmannia glutinosa]|uniref:Uncharacterized protein n=1 Tax=Rehmannia glutinosa TaxID=99300 RepID=A0ABR0XF33_REHGL